MFFKLVPRLFLAALFFIAVLPGFSQVVPAAYEGGLPIAVGGGVSFWDPDWNTGYIVGTTLWVDYFPPVLPRVLNGVGVEVEAHAVHWNRAGITTNFRQVTAGAESFTHGATSITSNLTSSSRWVWEGTTLITSILPERNRISTMY